MRFTVTSTNSSTFASISLHTPVIRTSSAVCVKLSRSLFYFSLFIFFFSFKSYVVSLWHRLQKLSTLKANGCLEYLWSEELEVVWVTNERMIDLHFNSNIVVECVCLRFAWELIGAAELPNISIIENKTMNVFFFGGGVHSEEFFQHVEGNYPKSCSIISCI